LRKVAGAAADWNDKPSKSNEPTEEVKNSFMIALRKASNNLEPCQKCDYVVNVLKKGQKTIIFSEFISAGLDILKKRLDDEDIKYLEIKGNVSKSKRDEIVKAINSDAKNSPKVLFVTKAGGQGLDLKGIRNVILFEVGWSESTADQVIGRARRYKSHEHLPEEERDVTVYRLMTITKEDRTLLNYVNNDFAKLLSRYKDVASADLYLYLYSMRKRMTTDELQRKLEKVDINNRKC
jgi:superfamily II DNA/RNA helicase